MFEVLAGESGRECARPRTIELSGQGKDQARCQVMRETRLGRSASLWGVNFFDADFAGAAPCCLSRSSVNENSGIDMADALCQLWRELMQAQNFDFPVREFPLESVGHAPGEAVVGTQRIPVGDDQHGNKFSKAPPFGKLRAGFLAKHARNRGTQVGFRSKAGAPPRQERIVSTGQGACAITWCAVDHGRCVVPTWAELRAPSTIRSASRSSANLRIHSLAEPNSSKVSGV